jgi:hypothetical protein
MRSLITIAIATVVLSGCAANMAATGNPGPKLSAVKQQHTRVEVEHLLGVPEETISRSNTEVVELYVVEAHTEPNALRAAGHVTADVLTSGLWEFAGVPIEARKGRPQRLIVRYDGKDQVKSIRREPASKAN